MTICPPRPGYGFTRPAARLTGLEIVGVMPRLARFAEDWTSHGSTLHASAEFLHQQFLVIGLDENLAGASGCSIDASVRFVAQLEKQLNVELLDKSLLAFFRTAQCTCSSAAS
ncbi:hypothetical protein ACFQT0_03260 [Hymenobacter humi]|uniref:Uncharacterized protein n=1 Tax=Hymenobacter humi TaxID=1411620 RepID=A0ABW2U0V4_9BACT